MFPRRQRLPRSAFPAALSSGQRLSSEHLSIILPKEAEGYAVIVPKKVARLSVTRHHIRRRVLAAMRGLPLPSALIVFPRASVALLPYEGVKKEFAALLSKIRG
ncbi:MAG: ribonuclease P protein component [Patescibacteria group bacterium]|nr:ribonuclease P protein component [Patescibacteria group bacterium]